MLCRAALNACDAAVASNLVHTAVRGPGAHDELVPWYQQVPTAGRYRVTVVYSDISFGMCLCLMSWVQQVHSAAVVARSLGCQCDTEMPTGRTLTET